MTTQSSSTQFKTQATIPITVEQILSCKQPQLRIYDLPVQVACIVGIVRNLNIESCEVSCYIEDSSGRIQGTMRLETEAEVAVKLSGIEENSYAKVFGFVRNQDDRKTVFILKIFPVDDLNVITHHLWQVFWFISEAKAERTKRLASANSSGAALADSIAMPEETSSEVPQLSDFQRLIFNIVKSECSDVGISKRSILRQFPSYQGHEVNQALDYLINEGLIYYSIDQEHLKTTIQY